MRFAIAVFRLAASAAAQLERAPAVVIDVGLDGLTAGIDEDRSLGLTASES